MSAAGIAQAAVAALVPAVVGAVIDASRAKKSVDDAAVDVLAALLKAGASPAVLARHLTEQGRLEGELAGDVAQIAATGSLGP